MHERIVGKLNAKFGRWPLDPERPTLVMIHGSGGSSVSWEPQVGALAQRANTAAVDLPGHSQSPGPPHEEVGRYADRLSEWIEAASVPNPILVGHSLGGAISLQILLDRPSTIQGAVLAGTGAKLRVMPAIIQSIETDFAASMKMFDQIAASPNTPATLLDRYREEAAQQEPSTVAGDFRACDAFDVRDRLGEIRHPVLVVSGSEDMLTPPKYADFLTEKLSNAAQVRIEETGHMMMLERAEAFNEAVIGHLDRLAAGR